MARTSKAAVIECTTARKKKKIPRTIKNRGYRLRFELNKFLEKSYARLKLLAKNHRQDEQNRHQFSKLCARQDDEPVQVLCTNKAKTQSCTLPRQRNNFEKHVETPSLSTLKLLKVPNEINKNKLSLYQNSVDNMKNDNDGLNESEDMFYRYHFSNATFNPIENNMSTNARAHDLNPENINLSICRRESEKNINMNHAIFEKSSNSATQNILTDDNGYLKVVFADSNNQKQINLKRENRLREQYFSSGQNYNENVAKIKSDDRTKIKQSRSKGKVIRKVTKSISKTSVSTVKGGKLGRAKSVTTVTTTKIIKKGKQQQKIEVKVVTSTTSVTKMESRKPQARKKGKTAASTTSMTSETMFESKFDKDKSSKKPRYGKHPAKSMSEVSKVKKTFSKTVVKKPSSTETKHVTKKYYIITASKSEISPRKVKRKLSSGGAKVKKSSSRISSKTKSITKKSAAKSGKRIVSKTISSPSQTVTTKIVRTSSVTVTSSPSKKGKKRSSKTAKKFKKTSSKDAIRSDKQVITKKSITKKVISSPVTKVGKRKDSSVSSSSVVSSETTTITKTVSKKALQKKISPTKKTKKESPTSSKTSYVKSMVSVFEGKGSKTIQPKKGSQEQKVAKKSTIPKENKYVTESTTVTENKKIFQDEMGKDVTTTETVKKLKEKPFIKPEIEISEIVTKTKEKPIVKEEVTVLETTTKTQEKPLVRPEKISENLTKIKETPVVKEKFEVLKTITKTKEKPAVREEEIKPKETPAVKQETEAKIETKTKETPVVKQEVEATEAVKKPKEKPTVKQIEDFKAVTKTKETPTVKQETEITKTVEKTTEKPIVTQVEISKIVTETKEAPAVKREEEVLETATKIKEKPLAGQDVLVAETTIKRKDKPDVKQEVYTSRQEKIVTKVEETKPVADKSKPQDFDYLTQLNFKEQTKLHQVPEKGLVKDFTKPTEIAKKEVEISEKPHEKISPKPQFKDIVKTTVIQSSIIDKFKTKKEPKPETKEIKEVIESKDKPALQDVAEKIKVQKAVVDKLKPAHVKDLGDQQTLKIDKTERKEIKPESKKKLQEIAKQVLVQKSIITKLKPTTEQTKPSKEIIRVGTVKKTVRSSTKVVKRTISPHVTAPRSIKDTKLDSLKKEDAYKTIITTSSTKIVKKTSRRSIPKKVTKVSSIKSIRKHGSKTISSKTIKKVSSKTLEKPSKVLTVKKSTSISRVTKEPTRIVKKVSSTSVVKVRKRSERKLPRHSEGKTATTKITVKKSTSITKVTKQPTHKRVSSTSLVRPTKSAERKSPGHLKSKASVKKITVKKSTSTTKVSKQPTRIVKKASSTRLAKPSKSVEKKPTKRSGSKVVEKKIVVKKSTSISRATKQPTRSVKKVSSTSTVKPSKRFPSSSPGKTSAKKIMVKRSSSVSRGVKRPARRSPSIQRRSTTRVVKSVSKTGAHKSQQSSFKYKKVQTKKKGESGQSITQAGKTSLMVGGKYCSSMGITLLPPESTLPNKNDIKVVKLKKDSVHFKKSSFIPNLKPQVDKTQKAKIFRQIGRSSSKKPRQTTRKSQISLTSNKSTSKTSTSSRQVPFKEITVVKKQTHVQSGGRNVTSRSTSITSKSSTSKSSSKTILTKEVKVISKNLKSIPKHQAQKSKHGSQSKRFSQFESKSMKMVSSSSPRGKNVTTINKTSLSKSKHSAKGSKVVTKKVVSKTTISSGSGRSMKKTSMTKTKQIKKSPSEESVKSTVSITKTKHVAPRKSLQNKSKMNNNNNNNNNNKWGKDSDDYYLQPPSSKKINEKHFKKSTKKKDKNNNAEIKYDQVKLPYRTDSMTGYKTSLKKVIHSSQGFKGSTKASSQTESSSKITSRTSFTKSSGQSSTGQSKTLSSTVSRSSPGTTGYLEGKQSYTSSSFSTSQNISKSRGLSSNVDGSYVQKQQQSQIKRKTDISRSESMTGKNTIQSTTNYTSSMPSTSYTSSASITLTKSRDGQRSIVTKSSRTKTEGTITKTEGTITKTEGTKTKTEGSRTKTEISGTKTEGSSDTRITNLSKEKNESEISSSAVSSISEQRGAAKSPGGTVTKSTSERKIPGGTVSVKAEKTTVVSVTKGTEHRGQISATMKTTSIRTSQQRGTTGQTSVTQGLTQTAEGRIKSAGQILTKTDASAVSASEKSSCNVCHKQSGTLMASRVVNVNKSKHIEKKKDEKGMFCQAIDITLNNQDLYSPNQKQIEIKTLSDEQKKKLEKQSGNNNRNNAKTITLGTNENNYSGNAMDAGPNFSYETEPFHITKDNFQSNHKSNKNASRTAENVLTKPLKNYHVLKDGITPGRETNALKSEIYEKLCEQANKLVRKNKGSFKNSTVTRSVNYSYKKNKQSSRVKLKMHRETPELIEKYIKYKRDKLRRRKKITQIRALTKNNSNRKMIAQKLLTNNSATKYTKYEQVRLPHRTEEVKGYKVSSSERTQSYGTGTSKGSSVSTSTISSTTATHKRGTATSRSNATTKASAVSSVTHKSANYSSATSSRSSSAVSSQTQSVSSSRSISSSSSGSSQSSLTIQFSGSTQKRQQRTTEADKKLTEKGGMKTTTTVNKTKTVDLGKIPKTVQVAIKTTHTVAGNKMDNKGISTLTTTLKEPKQEQSKPRKIITLTGEELKRKKEESAKLRKDKQNNSNRKKLQNNSAAPDTGSSTEASSDVTRSYETTLATKSLPTDSLTRTSKTATTNLTQTYGTSTSKGVTALSNTTRTDNLPTEQKTGETTTASSISSRTSPLGSTSLSILASRPTISSSTGDNSELTQKQPLDAKKTNELDAGKSDATTAQTMTQNIDGNKVPQKEQTEQKKVDTLDKKSTVQIKQAEGQKKVVNTEVKTPIFSVCAALKPTYVTSRTVHTCDVPKKIMPLQTSTKVDANVTKEDTKQPPKSTQATINADANDKEDTKHTTSTKLETKKPDEPQRGKIKRWSVEKEKRKHEDNAKLKGNTKNNSNVKKSNEIISKNKSNNEETDIHDFSHRSKKSKKEKSNIYRYENSKVEKLKTDQNNYSNCSSVSGKSVLHGRSKHRNCRKTTIKDDKYSDVKAFYELTNSVLNNKNESKSKKFQRSFSKFSKSLRGKHILEQCSEESQPTNDKGLRKQRYSDDKQTNHGKHNSNKENWAYLNYSVNQGGNYEKNGYKTSSTFVSSSTAKTIPSSAYDSSVTPTTVRSSIPATTYTSKTRTSRTSRDRASDVSSRRNTISTFSNLSKQYSSDANTIKTLTELSESKRTATKSLVSTTSAESPIESYRFPKSGKKLKDSAELQRIQMYKKSLKGKRNQLKVPGREESFVLGSKRHKVHLKSMGEKNMASFYRHYPLLQPNVMAAMTAMEQKEADCCEAIKKINESKKTDQPTKNKSKHSQKKNEKDQSKVLKQGEKTDQTQTKHQGKDLKKSPEEKKTYTSTLNVTLKANANEDESKRKITVLKIDKSKENTNESKETIQSKGSENVSNNRKTDGVDKNAKNSTNNANCQNWIDQNQFRQKNIVDHKNNLGREKIEYDENGVIVSDWADKSNSKRNNAIKMKNEKKTSNKVERNKKSTTKVNKKAWENYKETTTHVKNIINDKIEKNIEQNTVFPNSKNHFGSSNNNVKQAKVSFFKNIAQMLRAAKINFDHLKPKMITRSVNNNNDNQTQSMMNLASFPNHEYDVSQQECEKTKFRKEMPNEKLLENSRKKTETNSKLPGSKSTPFRADIAKKYQFLKDNEHDSSSRNKTSIFLNANKPNKSEKSLIIGMSSILFNSNQNDKCIKSLKVEDFKAGNENRMDKKLILARSTNMQNSSNNFDQFGNSLLKPVMGLRTAKEMHNHDLDANVPLQTNKRRKDKKSAVENTNSNVCEISFLENYTDTKLHFMPRNKIKKISKSKNRKKFNKNQSQNESEVTESSEKAEEITTNSTSETNTESDKTKEAKTTEKPTALNTSTELINESESEDHREENKINLKSQQKDKKVLIPESNETVAEQTVKTTSTSSKEIETQDKTKDDELKGEKKLQEVGTSDSSEKMKLDATYQKVEKASTDLKQDEKEDTNKTKPHLVENVNDEKEKNIPDDTESKETITEKTKDTITVADEQKDKRNKEKTKITLDTSGKTEGDDENEPPEKIKKPAKREKQTAKGNKQKTLADETVIETTSSFKKTTRKQEQIADDDEVIQQKKPKNETAKKKFKNVKKIISSTVTIKSSSSKRTPTKIKKTKKVLKFDDQGDEKIQMSKVKKNVIKKKKKTSSTSVTKIKTLKKKSSLTSESGPVFQILYEGDSSSDIIRSTRAKKAGKRKGKSDQSSLVRIYIEGSKPLVTASEYEILSKLETSGDFENTSKSIKLRKTYKEKLISDIEKLKKDLNNQEYIEKLLRAFPGLDKIDIITLMKTKIIKKMRLINELNNIENIDVNKPGSVYKVTKIDSNITFTISEETLGLDKKQRKPDLAEELSKTYVKQLLTDTLKTTKRKGGKEIAKKSPMKRIIKTQVRKRTTKTTKSRKPTVKKKIGKKKVSKRGIKSKKRPSTRRNKVSTKKKSLAKRKITSAKKSTKSPRRKSRQQILKKSGKSPKKVTKKSPKLKPKRPTKKISNVTIIESETIEKDVEKEGDEEPKEQTDDISVQTTTTTTSKVISEEKIAKKPKAKRPTKKSKKKVITPVTKKVKSPRRKSKKLTVSKKSTKKPSKKLIKPRSKKPSKSKPKTKKGSVRKMKKPVTKRQTKPSKRLSKSKRRPKSDSGTIVKKVSKTTITKVTKKRPGAPSKPRTSSKRKPITSRKKKTSAIKRPKKTKATPRKPSKRLPAAKVTKKPLRKKTSKIKPKPKSRSTVKKVSKTKITKISKKSPKAKRKPKSKSRSRSTVKTVSKTTVTKVTKKRPAKQSRISPRKKKPSKVKPSKPKSKPKTKTRSKPRTAVKTVSKTTVKKVTKKRPVVKSKPSVTKKPKRSLKKPSKVKPKPRSKSKSSEETVETISETTVTKITKKRPTKKSTKRRSVKSSRTKKTLAKGRKPLKKRSKKTITPTKKKPVKRKSSIRKTPSKPEKGSKAKLKTPVKRRSVAKVTKSKRKPMKGKSSVSVKTTTIKKIKTKTSSTKTSVSMENKSRKPMKKTGSIRKMKKSAVVKKRSKTRRKVKPKATPKRKTKTKTRSVKRISRRKKTPSVRKKKVKSIESSVVETSVTTVKTKISKSKLVRKKKPKISAKKRASFKKSPKKSGRRRPVKSVKKSKGAKVKTRKVTRKSKTVKLGKELKRITATGKLLRRTRSKRSLMVDEDLIERTSAEDLETLKVWTNLDKLQTMYNDVVLNVWTKDSKTDIKEQPLKVFKSGRHASDLSMMAELIMTQSTDDDSAVAKLKKVIEKIISKYKLTEILNENNQKLFKRLLSQKRKFETTKHGFGMNKSIDDFTTLVEQVYDTYIQEKIKCKKKSPARWKFPCDKTAKAKQDKEVKSLPKTATESGSLATESATSITTSSTVSTNGSTTVAESETIKKKTSLDKKVKETSAETVTAESESVKKVEIDKDKKINEMLNTENKTVESETLKKVETGEGDKMKGLTAETVTTTAESESTKLVETDKAKKLNETSTESKTTTEGESVKKVETSTEKVNEPIIESKAPGGESVKIAGADEGKMLNETSSEAKISTATEASSEKSGETTTSASATTTTTTESAIENKAPESAESSPTTNNNANHRKLRGPKSQLMPNQSIEKTSDNYRKTLKTNHNYNNQDRFIEKINSLKENDLLTGNSKNAKRDKHFMDDVDQVKKMVNPTISKDKNFEQRMKYFKPPLIESTNITSKNMSAANSYSKKHLYTDHRMSNDYHENLTNSCSKNVCQHSRFSHNKPLLGHHNEQMKNIISSSDKSDIFAPTKHQHKQSSKSSKEIKPDEMRSLHQNYDNYKAQFLRKKLYAEGNLNRNNNGSLDDSFAPTDTKNTKLDVNSEILKSSIKDAFLVYDLRNESRERNCPTKASTRTNMSYHLNGREKTGSDLRNYQMTNPFYNVYVKPKNNFSKSQFHDISCCEDDYSEEEMITNEVTKNHHSIPNDLESLQNTNVNRKKSKKKRKHKRENKRTCVRKLYTRSQVYHLLKKLSRRYRRRMRSGRHRSHCYHRRRQSGLCGNLMRRKILKSILSGRSHKKKLKRLLCHLRKRTSRKHKTRHHYPYHHKRYLPSQRRRDCFRYDFDHERVARLNNLLNNRRYIGSIDNCCTDVTRFNSGSPQMCSCCSDCCLINKRSVDEYLKRRQLGSEDGNKNYIEKIIDDISSEVTKKLRDNGIVAMNSPKSGEHPGVAYDKRRQMCMPQPSAFTCFPNCR